MSETTQATPQTHTFQAEVQQLLHLMVHSLYSNREIFLRELVSNAADACDKLRFKAVTDSALLAEDTQLKIRVAFDADKKTITISDNGIGMTQGEVIENIGTIARSGTRKFIEQLQENDADKTQLIGQFGVGFYSAFIVADRVVLETRKAGESADSAVRWASNGTGEYTLETIEKADRGTTVTIELKDDAEEFANEYKLRSIVERYSGHISFPVEMLHTPFKKDDDEEEPIPEWQALNDTTALWTKAKNEIDADEYAGFYKSLTHDHNEPLTWTHNRVEGNQSYTNLLYVPAKAPFDMAFNRDEKQGLKLYVQRVFIMDAAEQLLPNYLRFIRGVVDSADLPLNVSREILQENELLGKIKNAVVKRSLSMLKSVAADEEKYATFWTQFGSVLKEGVVEDFANRDDIARLLRFSSTKTEGDTLTGIEDYVARMAPEQDCIWYVTADNLKAAAGSPHLEYFREQGIEVLLLGDRIDEWLMSYWNEFDEKPFKSITRRELSDDDKPELSDAQTATLEKLQTLLDGKVSTISASKRLKDAAACLVMGDDAMPMHMQMMMRQAGQDVPDSQPGLEVNLEHTLWQRITEAEGDLFDDYGQLLFEQAVLSEGGQLDDPAGFVQRLNRLLK